MKRAVHFKHKVRRSDRARHAAEAAAAAAAAVVVPPVTPAQPDSLDDSLKAYPYYDPGEDVVAFGRAAYQMLKPRLMVFERACLEGWDMPRPEWLAALRTIVTFLLMHFRRRRRRDAPIVTLATVFDFVQRFAPRTHEYCIAVVGAAALHMEWANDADWARARSADAMVLNVEPVDDTPSMAAQPPSMYAPDHARLRDKLVCAARFLVDVVLEDAKADPDVWHHCMYVAAGMDAYVPVVARYLEAVQAAEDAAALGRAAPVAMAPCGTVAGTWMRGVPTPRAVPLTDNLPLEPVVKPTTPGADRRPMPWTILATFPLPHAWMFVAAYYVHAVAARNEGLMCMDEAVYEPIVDAAVAGSGTVNRWLLPLVPNVT
jgi:hypothetical protein